MKTILIVDDIKVNLKVLEVLLTRNGYAVLSAMSAGKALGLLQKHLCDLIISDIQMPEMDGFQFCRLCQLDEKLKHIPFIFYSSARDEKQIQQQARKVGAQAVVRKPADPAGFLKTIDTVLNDALNRTQGLAGQDRFLNRRLDRVPGIVGWTLDANGDFTDISPAVARLTGFPVKHIQEMGKSGWLNRVHSSDEQKVRNAYKQLFQNHVPLDIVYRFERRDNRFAWLVEKSGTPYGNQAHGCDRVDGFTADISADMTDLERRMEYREQRVIQTFSSGVSHDLDNMLNGIADYIQLSATTTASSRERQRFLANALKISRSALALNRDIFYLSGEDKAVEKNSLLTRVVARVVRSLMQGSDIPCRVEIPRGVWPCRVDTRLMARALEHVIINACEAVAQKHDGKIEVTLQNISIEDTPVETRPVSETRPDPGRYVQLSISDNGCGIDDPYLDQVCLPYFSLKPKDMKKGVGLSLAISRAIIAGHGGEMAVHSKKNHGTKIWVLLPAEPGRT
ncbi:response regulator [Desulfotignum phosphitoxidans]|uniref:histidine kinase n=1 Tax=Desulfotignum phosphitoxidans DSM 13687 TaxID=1286635 RepID=S0FZM0_9BACT|nr:response regulator [Desulfotignum phosphitoxidans]EMS80583.1 PAS/PAC sensor hybrid histidine kinase [Desulfotignum phosphitoxidans DSM 13687]